MLRKLWPGVTAGNKAGMGRKKGNWAVERNGWPALRRAHDVISTGLYTANESLNTTSETNGVL